MDTHRHARVEGIMYLDMDFAVFATSQYEVGASALFFFHWMIFAEPLSKPRAMFFLVHLVAVTRSSTWTSLTSKLAKWVCNFPIVRHDGFRKDERGAAHPLEEWELASGLVCVDTSFLKMTEDIVVVPSLELSAFSSANHIKIIPRCLKHHLNYSNYYEES